MVSTFKPGVGQNIALNVLPAARNSTVLIPSFSVHSTSFLPKPSLHLFCTAGYSGCRYYGPLCQEPRAMKGSFFYAWRISLTCFACCQVFYLTNFYFPIYLISFKTKSCVHFSRSRILLTQKLRFSLVRTEHYENWKVVSFFQETLLSLCTLYFTQMPGDSYHRRFRSLLFCHLFYAWHLIKHY